jgi:hypothetical protein
VRYDLQWLPTIRLCFDADNVRRGPIAWARAIARR